MTSLHVAATRELSIALEHLTAPQHLALLLDLSMLAFYALQGVPYGCLVH